jgi:hypothetical protein
LDKNPNQRPEITYLLQTKYLKKAMQQFVSFSETGKTPVSIQSIPIKQTQVHAEVRLIR